MKITVTLRNSILTLAVLVLAGASFSGSAAAQSVKRIGDYRDWSAYTTTENGNPVCFIASVPTESEGNYTRRGNAFAIVTLRPTDDRNPEVSFIAGYTYEEDSAVEVTLDGSEQFRFFTQDDAAWLPNEPGADADMIDSMREGLEMVVKGTSNRGTLTTDTYSLRGFTASYQAMQDACPDS